MLFDSTRTLLRSILHSLETGGDIRWDDHLESGNQCIYELYQMARPSHQAYRLEKSTSRSSASPDSERAIRAIPHVKLMVGAIRRKDLVTAIGSGKAGFTELTATSFTHTLERSVPKPAPAPAPAVQQPAPVRPAPKPVAKPALKSSRPRLAGSAKPKRAAATAKRRPQRVASASRA